jgi:hypothetical protein
MLKDHSKTKHSPYIALTFNNFIIYNSFHPQQITSNAPGYTHVCDKAFIALLAGTQISVVALKFFQGNFCVLIFCSPHAQEGLKISIRSRAVDSL